MVGGGGWGIDWVSFASGILLVWIFWRERDGSTAVAWGCCEHGLRVGFGLDFFFFFSLFFPRDTINMLELGN